MGEPTEPGFNISEARSIRAAVTEVLPKQVFILGDTAEHVSGEFVI